MKPHDGEDKFQGWVQERIIGAGGHYEDHRYSHGVGVPDLSCGFGGRDYWLELKYGEFKLLHRKYDDFHFVTMQRRQLDWLQKRSATGRATCGVLGYFLTTGDHKLPKGTPGIGYYFFATVGDYLQNIWQKRLSTGAVILSGRCAAAHSIKTGPDLFRFIDDRAPGPLRQR